MKKNHILAILALGGFSLAANAGDLKPEDCPAPVLETIRAHIGNGKIDDVKSRLVENRTVYEVEIEMPDNTDKELQIAENGQLIKTRTDVEKAAAPPVIQQAAQGLVPQGGRIDDVDKEVAANGQTTYHVDIERPGAADLEVVLAENGAVISREEDTRD